MPGPRSDAEIKGIWGKFVAKLRGVAFGLPEHRHQDQFRRAQEAAFDLAAGSVMADEIAKGYREALGTAGNAEADADAIDIAVMELEAFPLAVGIHEEEKQSGKAKSGARAALRRAAKTILGSIKDVFKLSERGKQILCVLDEALDFAEGD